MTSRMTDLTAARSEYSDLLFEIDIRNESQLDIITLERESFVVTCDARGWFTNKNMGEIFETIEACLMKISPQFANKWHSKLANALLPLHKG